MPPLTSWKLSRYPFFLWSAPTTHFLSRKSSLFLVTFHTFVLKKKKSMISPILLLFFFSFWISGWGNSNLHLIYDEVGYEISTRLYLQQLSHCFPFFFPPPFFPKKNIIYIFMYLFSFLDYHLMLTRFVLKRNLRWLCS